MMAVVRRVMGPDRIYVAAAAMVRLLFFVFSRKAESVYRNGMQATKAAISIAFELFNMPNLSACKHDTQKCRQHHCRISMEGQDRGIMLPSTRNKKLSWSTRCQKK